MSYKNLQEAIKLIEQNIEKCDSIRPQLDDNIVNAEINLGVIFPKSYKKFLKLIGRLSLGSVDVFGLTFNDYSQYIPNDVVCETIEQRNVLNAREFPKSFIPIYDLGDGEIFCLDSTHINSKGECPIFAWYFGRIEKIYEDFGDFLLEKVLLGLESLEEEKNN